MNFLKKLTALVLCGAMCLALCACSGGAADPSPSPSATPDTFEVDTSVEDLTLATAGIAGDFELFTVNGTPVKARLYTYLLARSIAYMESLSSTGINLETWGAYLKEDAMNAAAWYTMVVDKALEMDCDMTQEQKDDLDSTIAINQILSGGEEAFHDELRKIGLDYDCLYMLNSTSYYYLQMQNALYADRPTADEMADYIEDNDILYAKHILLLTQDMTTGEALDAETIAQKKATAESVLKQLQESGDLLTDFDTLMNEYSEDTGLASYPDGYTFTAGEMVEEFEEGTRALEYGQISGIVESDFGYHIILRLDPATESLKSEYRTSLLDEQFTKWLTEAEIVQTEEFKNLDVLSFYEKFTAYQEAFAAEEEAQSSEGTTEE